MEDNTNTFENIIILANKINDVCQGYSLSLVELAMTKALFQFRDEIIFGHLLPEFLESYKS